MDDEPVSQSERDNDGETNQETGSKELPRAMMKAAIEP
jgi:hypothetical protein